MTEMTVNDPVGIRVRVIITEDNIRKLVLQSMPESLQVLETIIRDKFEIKGCFTLQYMDPDFDNQFMSVTSIRDIVDRATIKIFKTSVSDSESEIAESMYDLLSSPDESFTSLLASTSYSTSSTMSSDDTIILSEKDSSESGSSGRTLQWPVSFPIPRFSYDTEMKLAKGNKMFQKDGTLLTATGMKSDILEKLAETVFSYKAYPSDTQVSSVAEALILKHPCLKEPGSSSGYHGWKISLKFKMGNYRSKLRNNGCTELMANSLKRKDGTEKKPAKNIKKPRKAEVNYLPDYPEGETAATLEKERVILLDELKKKGNEKVVLEKMAQTFSHRRQEVVLDKPLVAEFKARWPGLFSETEVSQVYTIYY